MSVRFPPVHPRLPKLIHGGDYNPEQWLCEPDALKEDLRMMKLAGCNAMSIGMFAWSALEPSEGRYEFGWLDRVMDGLASHGLSVVLSTPSGGRPAWMSQRYPEVLRVNAERTRSLHGLRHNHCYTSPVYRQKVRAINERLAERYRGHPALILWHVSNEYGGECHCELCQAAFRQWLRIRYADDLDRLNRAWWAPFWSHTFTAWEQLQSPAPHGEPLFPSLTLDWKRFVTHQTVDFMRLEIEPLRRITPEILVTTNLMGPYPGLDYGKLARYLDVTSWNSYPCWHGTEPDWKVAADTAFSHDLMRSLKSGRPFLLMESAPTFSNWHQVRKLKRPGVHALTSLLAVAHGSDSVQYFQWRAGRGGIEQFHGAVVDHAGTEATRVFKEVAELGDLLGGLDEIVGTSVPAQAALIFDWENRWALEAAAAARPDGPGSYEETCKRHHRALGAEGILVDVVDADRELAAYRLVVAPLLFMVREGVADRLTQFVRSGGTLVVTYLSGMVDSCGLCFTGGFPGPLRALLGIWAEEIDELYPGERNRLVPEAGNELGLSGSYAVSSRCALINAETARVLATFGDDFYRGRPALTVKETGEGRAFYLAADAEERFLTSFYRGLFADRRIAPTRAPVASLPEGVLAQVRIGESHRYLFLLNFARHPATVRLIGNGWTRLPGGASAPSKITLEPYGLAILRRSAGP